MRKRGWKNIKSAPRDGTKVHLWMDIYASPMSFGMSDAFAVPDSWFQDGKWVHIHRGEIAALRNNYVTHWMPVTGDLSGQDVWKG